MKEKKHLKLYLAIDFVNFQIEMNIKDTNCLLEHFHNGHQQFSSASKSY